MNDTVPSGKRADAVTNRTRLLHAAIAVFAEAGLELEVHDVASRAGVGVGTLYRHFGNREDLLRAIVTAVVEETMAGIQQAIQPCADDPRAALFALISSGLRVQQQYESIFSVIRDPRLTRLFDREQREALWFQFIDVAQGVIVRGIQQGVFRQDCDPELVAAIILGAFMSVFESPDSFSRSDELEQRLSRHFWMMLARERV